MPLNRSVRETADAALELVREAATRTRTWGVFQAGKATAAQLRATLARLILGGRDRILTIALRFAEGSGGVADWSRRTLASLIPLYHAGALTTLGILTLARDQQTDLDRLTARQATYLGRFRDAVAGGSAPPAVDGRPSPGFLARAQLYASAAWGVGEQVKRDQRERDGFRLERRILGSKRPCHVCLEQAALGWKLIGTLLGIGEGSPCLANCNCHMLFR